jgi:hypothetical protein
MRPIGWSKRCGDRVGDIDGDRVGDIDEDRRRLEMETLGLTIDASMKAMNLDIDASIDRMHR